MMILQTQALRFYAMYFTILLSLGGGEEDDRQTTHEELIWNYWKSDPVIQIFPH